MLDQIRETALFIQQKTTLKPVAGIILGTGLAGLGSEIDPEVVIPYEEIPHFPVSTVQGHHGKLIIGHLGNKPVIAMQGRFHFYEGWTMAQVVFPVRVMKWMGVNNLLLSNASGGVNPDFEIGDLMIISDHINLFPTNPLMGPNIDELGPRFPDMSEAYDKKLVSEAENIAQEEGIAIQKGVYAGLSGPCLETPAEYTYVRNTGADTVGMSTVPEVIAARHMGMRCFGMSIITDLGVPGKIVKVTHEDVQRVAEAAEPKLTTIFKTLVARLS
ncbi:MAG: purine-nucleoside phosphorylase [Cryomorphaceae bacterium]|nr:MAG: purine-nucleoside phosphorylase [Cryomorphaceae bacterium]